MWYHATMQRKTGISRPAPARIAATPAAKANDGELAAWLARYEPVEREVIEAHERRIANRERRAAERARAFGGLCEATEGFANAKHLPERLKSIVGCSMSAYRGNDIA